MQFKYPFIKPEFPSSQEMTEDYEAIIAANWFTNFGPYEQKLSTEVANFVSPESGHATTVANCTLGLDLAIEALFNSEKKFVITQSFTFAAGPEMLIKNGYTPIFLDVQPGSWQMDINQARELLQFNDDIAGILLCNTFGVGNLDIADWEDLAKEKQVALIVDTAAGFGSKYNDNELVGARGDCEVFSLHATKPFAVGEGGLVTSKNNDLIEKIRSLQNFGFGNDKLVHQIGTNAKMQEINCAIGLRQLKKLKSRVEHRQYLLGVYKELLVEHGFTFQDNDSRSTVAFVSMLVPEGYKAGDIQKKLIDNSVEARRYYTPALHDHPKLIENSKVHSELTVTNDLTSRILSLPLLNDMEYDDVRYICNLIIGMNKD